MSFANFLHRAVAWLTRNPEARANALALAAVATRARAAERERQGRDSAARRLRERADLFDARAQQLRRRA